jgi:hypothetical protein
MAAEEEPSRATSGCVLVALAGGAVAGLFAVDEAAGVLGVMAAGTFALWRSARRMSDSSATPPPGEDRPSCDVCAGQTSVTVAPLEGQKGMWIYRIDLPDRPGHTHVHLGQRADASHA